MRRINSIKANVTDEELAAIKAHVATLGISISDFVRQSVLESCGVAVDRVSQLEQRISELESSLQSVIAWRERLREQAQEMLDKQPTAYPDLNDSEDESDNWVRRMN